MTTDPNPQSEGREGSTDAVGVAGTRIVGGIEWFVIPGRPLEEDCQCARCGSSCGWADCCNCGGEGYESRYEEDPLWYDEDDMWPCDWCRTKGGHHFCLSGEEWCKANPLPGREHIKTTAYPEGQHDD